MVMLIMELCSFKLSKVYSYLVAPVVMTIMTVTAVPRSLNQVSSSRARARANQGAFLSAEQCACNQTCAGSDKRSLSSAVVLTAVVTSRAPLRVYFESSGSD